MKILDQAASVSTEECNIQQQLFLLNETIFIFSMRNYIPNGQQFLELNYFLLPFNSCYFRPETTLISLTRMSTVMVGSCQGEKNNSVLVDLRSSSHTHTHNSKETPPVSNGQVSRRRIKKTVKTKTNLKISTGPTNSSSVNKLFKSSIEKRKPRPTTSSGNTATGFSRYTERHF